jgi:hypothetical protein
MSSCGAASSTAVMLAGMDAARPANVAVPTSTRELRELGARLDEASVGALGGYLRNVDRRALERLRGSAHDVAGFAQALATLCENEATSLVSSAAMIRAGSRPEPDMLGSGLYPAVKAMFFFVRALQDAGCAVLLSTAGQQVGPYTSMNKATARESHPLHALIVAELPGYFDWFTDHRDLRNLFKEGVATWRATWFDENGEAHFAVQLPVVTPATARAGRHITIDDVCTSLRQSIALLQLIERRITALPKATERGALPRAAVRESKPQPGAPRSTEPRRKGRPKSGPPRPRPGVSSAMLVVIIALVAATMGYCAKGYLLVSQ